MISKKPTTEQVSNITLNEKWVKQILKNQEIIEELELVIDRHDGEENYEFTIMVLKEILDDVK
jgi:hypothetical protein